MSEPTRIERLAFIDVLRLIAAVQMIQGHSVASVLAPAYRAGPGFALWTFARGLTSVLFLTTAGLAFVLAEARAHDLPARRRRILRALRLIAIGYAMHAPLGVLVGVPWSSALGAALAVDVLQCIGASLLGLELLSVCLRSARVRIGAALALSALCLVGAPLVHELELTGAARLLGNYLNTRQGSLFPLLPWAGYVFAGFALGTAAFRARERMVRVLAMGGVASLAVGGLGQHAWPNLPLGVSPGYAAVKLGCVLLLAGLLAQLLRNVTRLRPLLTRLASETLFLYVSHVLILYADQVGLERVLRDRHGPWFGLALALVLLVACSAAALGFRRLVRSLRVDGRGSTRGAQPSR